MTNKKIVSIIGTGVIGAGWAARFIANGYHVQAFDPSPRSLKKLKTDVKKALVSLSKIGLHKNASIKNLSYHDNLKDALKDTSFVQENAPEKEKLKTSLLQEIDQLLDRKILIASSSSGLLPTKIQSKCKFPNRVLIGHPFNPVYLLPLVEIVKGKKTSQQSALKLKKIYEEIGMKPLMVRKEIEGYISDRLQEALWRESLHLIKDGIASTEEIDDAIVYGPGLRWAFMGVCLTFHLAGGEEGMKHMLEQFGPALKLPWTKLKAPKLSRKLINRLVDGTKKQSKGRTVEKISNIRDEYLLDLLLMRKKYEKKLR